MSNPKGSSGAKGTIGANGVAGPAGTTSGQQLFSSGVSVTQQTLQLVITSPPPSSVAVGAGFNLTVDVETGSATVDAGYDGPVTVQLSSNPGDATLGGTLTVNASNGVANFAGISINAGGNGYALQAVSGGVTSSSDTIDVTGSSTPPPPPPPTPTPAPIQVMGAPAVTKTKKGVTAISVGFSEALSPGSATNLGLYRVFVGVKKKRKLVYTKPLKIKSVTYDGARKR